MKKIIFILISFLMLMPSVYAGTYCTDEQIKAYREELNSVSYEITLNENITAYETLSPDSAYTLNKIYQIKFINLPDNVDVLISSDDFNTGANNTLETNLLDGGVYELEFYNHNCGLDIIKKYTIMIPYYNTETAENKWSDGTKEQTKIEDVIQNKMHLDIRILIGCIAFLVIVLIIVIVRILIKKRRSKL